ncbi:MAG: hypothetical protein V3S16_00040 [Candidatus Desulfatibia sp.]|uniref:hypothetical protein n=1 Tax=Candidatus Desulfatibia sp. TaxID=3101189 RepID=UPI002F31D3DC
MSGVLSPRRRLYPPACKPYGLEAEPEAAGFRHKGDRIYIDTPDIHALCQSFIRLCYHTPRAEKIIPAGLFLYNLLGRLGLARVRLSLFFPA